MVESMESWNRLKHSLCFMEMDPSLELMSQIEELNGSAMDIPSFGLMGHFNESYLSQQSELYMPFPDHLFGLLPAECQTTPTALPQPVGSVAEQSNGVRKRKDMEATDGRNEHYMAASSETGLTQVMMKKHKNKNSSSSGSGKRSARGNSKQAEKPKEVVHVRARRGQATDSHSLAERVRRERINERMRCLQDLVPGCYKTMGMAGMLDEIINYVQSLQNQVEFLSLKLSAVSSFYDYCFEMEAIATPQATGNGQEAARVVREGGYGGCTSFPSTMPY